MSAELNIKIPAINKAYYDDVSAKANQAKIVGVIRPRFGKMINNIADITNLPSELLEAFIFIESAGDPNAKSPYAIGLMQVSPAAASDALVKEKGAGRLSEPEAAILKKYLGSRYSLIESVKKGQTSLGKTFITKEDLFKPELNLLIGSILLKQLIDEFTQSDGRIRMDKVVTIYNGGRYGAVAKKIISFTGTIEEMMPQLPKETASYILKLLGSKGVLDTMV